MKNALAICFLFAATVLTAQKDETLFSQINRTGAWGGPIFEYSDLGNDLQAVVGGGGALIFNDFYFGGYGMGKADYTTVFQAEQRKDKVNFAHGGFWIGYTPIQRKVVHPYVSLRLGWGKARFESVHLQTNTLQRSLKDNLFVTIPEAGLEVNVFSFFRIAFTASYRWVNGVDNLPVYSDKDLSCISLGLTLRFGGFGRDD